MTSLARLRAVGQRMQVKKIPCSSGLPAVGQPKVLIAGIYFDYRHIYLLRRPAINSSWLEERAMQLFASLFFHIDPAG